MARATNALVRKIAILQLRDSDFEKGPVKILNNNIAGKSFWDIFLRQNYLFNTNIMLFYQNCCVLYANFFHANIFTFYSNNFDHLVSIFYQLR